MKAVDLRAESLMKKFQKEGTPRHTANTQTVTDLYTNDKGKEEMIPIPVARDIEEVLDHKKLRAGLRYHIKMKGNSQPVWVSEADLGDNAAVIQGYRRRVGLE